MIPTAPCLSLDATYAIVVCPYCFNRHRHGAAGAKAGQRSAHCGLGEYIIGDPLQNSIAKKIYDMKKIITQNASYN